ncbi:antitoxin Xre/MbcA/ParS toxin-binding domain-containing protein [Gordonia rhizosphera]|nr:antitoxin Xre/MbcA/ParS toxin-binding domain-containing protein [Gordonia rhizosphera]
MSKSTDDQVAMLARAFVTRLNDRLRRAERAGVDLTSALDDPDALADRMIAALPLGDPFDALIGPFYDMQGVIAFVGITKTAIVKRLRTGRLIGCQLADASRTWVFPAWQFGGDARLIDGMADVWAVLTVHADLWTAAAWMRSPNRGLDGQTPVSWLTEGRRIEDVVDAARRVSARWGA